MNDFKKGIFGDVEFSPEGISGDTPLPCTGSREDLEMAWLGLMPCPPRIPGDNGHKGR